MRSRAKLCGALLAVVVATAVLPVATASATLARSSVCKAYETEKAKEAKSSTALDKDVESGNWALIKKDLLAAFKGEADTEREFAGYLGSASSKVKSAAAVVLKLDSSFKSIAQSSSSLSAYEAGITAAESTPTVRAALKVLDAYTAKQCGTATPKT